MTNKILIVHPSRGRPIQALEAYNNYFSLCSDSSKITYILSIDVDDKNVEEYKRNFSCEILINENRGCVEAVNRAYSIDILGKHDFVILTSDDIHFCKDWDLLLQKEFDEYGYDKVVKTKQPGCDEKVLMLQIGGSQFFKDYGTFFWPEYISLCADNDMSEWAKKNNRWIQADHIVCPHFHHSLPGGWKFDETYARENSAFQQGLSILRKRRQQEFKN